MPLIIKHKLQRCRFRTVVSATGKAICCLPVMQGKNGKNKKIIYWFDSGGRILNSSRSLRPKAPQHRNLNNSKYLARRFTRRVFFRINTLEHLIPQRVGCVETHSRKSRKRHKVSHREDALRYCPTIYLF